MAVTFNAAKKELYIQDIGVTLRTLLAVAASGHRDSGVRRWHIVYKDVRIGAVSVKTDSKEISNAGHADSLEASAQTGKLAKALRRANLEVVGGPPEEDRQAVVSGVGRKSPRRVIRPVTVVETRHGGVGAGPKTGKPCLDG